MSGFFAPLWILGIGSGRPCTAEGVGIPIVGLAGQTFALPAVVGSVAPLAALPVVSGSASALLAKSAIVGSDGQRLALPVKTGVVYARN